MKLLDEIKKEIRPDDLALKDADSFIKTINELLKKAKVKAKCVRGGSTAKGTFLKGDHDIDLFVIFESVYRNTDISTVLLGVLNPLNPEVIHGSRDYFHITKKKMTYEIVPVIEVKNPDDIENVTDMSPHHVKWVNDRLNNNLRDDIRLTKKFCKAQRIYGAESYIQGFSGHVIDILIIYYGGFLKLLRAAKMWTPKVIIDVEKHWKDPLKNVDASKTYGPLLIVDPVQPKRNAAAAISLAKFDLFVKASKQFLRNPSKDFFKVNEFDLKTVKKNAKEKTLLALEIKADSSKTDVVGAKLVKIYEHLKKQLTLFGFTVTDSDWKWDKKKKCEMYFLINEKKLSETFVRCGPPISEKESCQAFKLKNEDVFLKNKRLYANVKRKYRTPYVLLVKLIKEDFIKSKAEKIKLV
jgi:tRNA nucleotidyltransferase (CCA-adding enzyme)